MKTNTLKPAFFIALGALLFGLISYGSNDFNKENKKDNQKPNGFINISSIVVHDTMAHPAIERFGRLIRDSLNISMEKKRRIPVAWLVDLDTLKGLHNSRYVRAYIGYKPAHYVGRAESDSSLQLMFVSVKNVNQSNPGGTDKLNGIITNLILPCPNTCDSESPFLESYEKGLGEEIYR